eukprot:2192732-Heterocapsa_arctica.AAC.1
MYHLWYSSSFGSPQCGHIRVVSWSTSATLAVRGLPGHCPVDRPVKSSEVPSAGGGLFPHLFRGVLYG